MSDLRDGYSVSYVGDGSDGRAVGDRGQLLVRTGSHGHVRWEADGAVTLHPLDFLVSAARQRHVAAVASDGLEDSLDVGPISMTGVRTTFDAEGSAGVLNEMAVTGALSTFPAIAQDALVMVASRIREDPQIRQVTAQLDDDEAEEVVQLASQALLRDAFGGLDG